MCCLTLSIALADPASEVSATGLLRVSLHAAKSQCRERAVREMIETDLAVVEEP